MPKLMVKPSLTQPSLFTARPDARYRMRSLHAVERTGLRAAFGMLAHQSASGYEADPATP